MITISIQRQLDAVMQEQRQWKICPTCWHINEMPVHFCRLCREWLGAYATYSLQTIALTWGIRVCPQCLLKYSAAIQTCNHCLCANEVVVFKKGTQQLLSEIPLSCTRCQELQDTPIPFCDQCGKLLRVPYTYTTDRPTIPLTLRHASTQIGCFGLVDSGASYNLFHGDLAAILGINLSNAPAMSFSGIVPGAIITGYQATVHLGLMGAFYETVMYFSFDLSPASPGLLGKVGFFDRFNIELDSANKQVVIRESPILERRMYQHCPQCRTHRAGPTSNFCRMCGCSLISPAVSSGWIAPHRQAALTNLLPLPSAPL